MAKHIKIFPDCPICGAELQATWKHRSEGGYPLWNHIEGWWKCLNCNYESEHFDHDPLNDIVEVIE